MLNQLILHSNSIPSISAFFLQYFGKTITQLQCRRQYFATKNLVEIDDHFLLDDSWEEGGAGLRPAASAARLRPPSSQLSSNQKWSSISTKFFVAKYWRRHWRCVIVIPKYCRKNAEMIANRWFSLIQTKFNGDFEDFESLIQWLFDSKHC